jgi:hypothetical protein
VSSTDNDNTDTDRGDLARVHYLPTTDQPDEAIEAEIITDEEYRRLTSQKAQAIARYQGYRRDIVATGRTVRTTVTHDRTKAVLRNVLCVPAGALVVGKRHLDDAVGVVDRGMDLLDPAGNGLPATEVADSDAGPDPLADIAAVLGGEQRMRTQEVLQRLAEYDRRAYGRWTFADLTAVLTKHQAAPYKSGGNMVVRADLVHAAITNRDKKRTAASVDGAGGD